MNINQTKDKEKDLLIKIESYPSENDSSLIQDLDPKSILLLEHQATYRFIIRLISLLTLFFGVIGFIIWFFFIP